MYTKDDVARLVDEIGKLQFDPPLEVGECCLFGLALDIFDPVSGQVITVARPHRHDLADHPQVLLTAEQVAAEVAGLRANRLHWDRTVGVLSPEQREAARKAAAAERELRAKHAAEMQELQRKNAEERAALAPKPVPTDEDKAADAAKAPPPKAEPRADRAAHR